MLFFLLFFKVKCEEISSQINEESENERVTYIMEVISRNSDKCPINLTNSLHTYCSHMDELKRRTLAIQLMICEMAKDGRGSSSKYKSDEQFLHSLSDDEFSMYTTFFTNLDTVCFQATRESQLQFINNRVDTIYSAVNFSADFLKAVGDKINAQSQKSNEELKDIEETVANSTELLENIVDFVYVIWDDVSTVLNMSVIYKEQIKSLKLYGKTLLITFVTSFVLPDILPTITSITALCIFLEMQFQNSKEFLNYMRYIHSFYYALCITIAISSLWSRIVFLKKKAIDPIITSLKPKKAKLSTLSIVS